MVKFTQFRSVYIVYKKVDKIIDFCTQKQGFYLLLTYLKASIQHTSKTQLVK